MELLSLHADDLGEVLTVQRAAYVTEAQLYGDPHLPPLAQTLEKLREEVQPGLTLVHLGKDLRP
jgi:hypothetical protein